MNLIKLTSTLLSISLLSWSIAPIQKTFAQEKEFTIPGAKFQLIEAKDLKEDITSFLKDHELIDRCLRGKADQEEEPLIAFVATCLALNAFDQTRYSPLKAWGVAVKTELVEDLTTKRSELNALEFLGMLFKTTGMSIPAIYEQEHFESLDNQGVRLREEHLKILAIAIESGIITPPYSPEEGRQLQRQLTRETLTIGKALSYTYQTWTAQESQPAVIEFSPFSQMGGIPAREDIALLNILKEVVNTIREESYYSDQFDEHDAMERAIRALVDDFEADKYMEYYSVDEYSNFTSNLNGSLEGIGAYVEQRDEKIIIVSPIEGGPADKVGVHPGDIITHIEGQSTQGMTLQDAINLIRGPKGTNINLTLERQGRSIDFTITRDTINVPALSTELRDNITIIKLTQFSQSSDVEMKQELDKIDPETSDGLIIDLRNNPGGYLNQVLNIVDFFVEADQPSVFIRDRNRLDTIKTRQNITAPKVPIAILINKGSASASEILSGILQSYGIAKVYGETSFGKGTVQNILPIPDNSIGGSAGFKYTIAEYLIPNPDGTWFSIDGTGVQPEANPGGPQSSLLDDPQTPQDEALEEVINDLKRGNGRALQFR